MASTKHQRGKPMWPSLALAEHVYDFANMFFLASLVVGFASTSAIIWSSNRKEEYLRRDLAAATTSAAHANKATEELRAKNLALQKILPPRRISFNGARAPDFAELKKFSGIPV